MVDIHCHILPGLDDGAGAVYDTLAMADLAARSGTRTIVATPHCNIPGVYENYLGEEYWQTFSLAQEAIRQEGIPLTLLPGMEVFATESLPRLIADGKLLGLNRTRNLLVEFEFVEDPDFARHVLARVAEAGMRPVVAHAERYLFVQDDPQIVFEWQALGYAVQANKGSFVGRFGSHAARTAWRLLDHNLITAIASDAHTPVMRTPYMADVFDMLAADYPPAYIEHLFFTNPRRLCRGEDPVPFRAVPFDESAQ